MSKNAEDSHVFLVINRDLTTPAENFLEWNEDALVVDPYLKKIYPASEIPTLLQSCSHDVESDKVHYIPYNPKQHKLDNSVQKEMLDDWQQAINTYKEHQTPPISKEEQEEETKPPSPFMNR